ncbi:MAG: biotin transporter BioY [Pseudomonadota bacterium]
MSSTSPRVEARARDPEAGFGLGVLLTAVAWAAAISIAARFPIALPGTDIPQTAQTLMVLLAGGIGGLTVGTLAVGIYVCAGALGLPVFADGASGLDVLLGPSGGYLIGFWFAAGLTGYAADRGMLHRWVPAALTMILAHVAILAVGSILLAARVGFVAAWFNGVAPFVLGGVVKSLIAALCVVIMARISANRVETA